MLQSTSWHFLQTNQQDTTFSSVLLVKPHTGLEWLKLGSTTVQLKQFMLMWVFIQFWLLKLNPLKTFLEKFNKLGLLCCKMPQKVNQKNILLSNSVPKLTMTWTDYYPIQIWKYLPQIYNQTTICILHSSMIFTPAWMQENIYFKKQRDSKNVLDNHSLTTNSTFLCFAVAILSSLAQLWASLKQ